MAMAMLGEPAAQPVKGLGSAVATGSFGDLSQFSSLVAQRHSLRDFAFSGSGSSPDRVARM
jgi:hypothetical protein